MEVPNTASSDITPRYLEPRPHPGTCTLRLQSYFWWTLSENLYRLYLSNSSALGNFLVEAPHFPSFNPPYKLFLILSPVIYYVCIILLRVDLTKASPVYRNTMYQWERQGLALSCQRSVPLPFTLIKFHHLHIMDLCLPLPSIFVY